MKDNNNILERLGQGIVGRVAELNDKKDHTINLRIKLFGYPLLTLMAWRTANILSRANGNSLVGWIMTGFGLLATEIGAYIWFDTWTKKADSGKDNLQKEISAVMFATNFLLSAVTSIADVIEVAGLAQFTNLQYSTAIVLIFATVWVVANVGAWMWYVNESPVTKATRKAEHEKFELEVRKVQCANEMDYLKSVLEIEEAHLQAKQALLARAAGVERQKRELGDQINSSLHEQTARGSAPRQFAQAPSPREYVHPEASDINEPAEEQGAVPVGERIMARRNGSSPKIGEGE